jgi:hypothetical protein
MEQMMVCLLAKMDSFLESVKASHEEVMTQIGSVVSGMDANQANIETNREELMAIMYASQEKIEAMMEAYLGKKEARIKACQGQVTTEIKTGLGEMEANQKKIEAIVEHQEVPNEEAAAVETECTGGPIWGPATGHWIPKPTEKADPRQCCARSP